VLSVWFFWASALALGLGYVGAPGWCRASSATVVRGIRDDEARVRFLGYPVEVYKLLVFTLSAMICGIAGALYYPQAGIINPAEIAPIASIYLAVWVAIGGRGRLYGAVIGAASCRCCRPGSPAARRPTWTSVSTRIDWVDWWPVLLGLGFVLVTLFAPKGHRRVSSTTSCGRRPR
jgi:urea transport system permease protein